MKIVDLNELYIFCHVPVCCTVRLSEKNIV
jgi:hypothetical protein